MYMAPVGKATDHLLSVEILDDSETAEMLIENGVCKRDGSEIGKPCDSQSCLSPDLKECNVTLMTTTTSSGESAFEFTISIVLEQSIRDSSNASMALG
nr:hypothetical protein HmN_000960200 [Hymenolepis microstoma]